MLRSIWSRQLPTDPRDRTLWWTWCGLSLILVVLAPTQVWDGVPFWTVPVGGLGQVFLAASAFLALVVWLETKARAVRGVSILAGVIGAAACYGSAYVVFARIRPDIVQSRGPLALASALGLALAFVPHLVPERLRVTRVAVLAATVVAVLWLGHRPRLMGLPQQETLTTALKPISKAYYYNLIPPATLSRGGAIEPYGDSYVLVTGDGDFYTLDWTTPSGAPVARRWALSLPSDRFASEEDERLAKARRGAHRVLDLKIDTSESPARIFVSSQEWNPTGRCFTLRVSEASMESAVPPLHRSDQAWTRLFETSPCVSEASASFAYLESGGRLAFLGDKLLLTVGDFGLGQSIQPAPSQALDSQYGKVLQLDRTGGYEIFTTGHRNPQGLLVGSDDRIWLTEHGPQGGDELNLLQRGNNYGYPLATYGTDYGHYVWPIAPNRHDHEAFTEPRLAFVPSVAISNLIQIESAAFVEWKHDLLIGSLYRKSLFRVRLRDDRVIYTEPIFLGVRVRDLAEGADGRIVTWTDEGEIVTLTPGQSDPEGSVVFARCRICHESPSGPMSLAPSIRGIVGAGVARVSGYEYSPALLRVGGRWTEDRLDAFLKDPNAFAPGSAMGNEQLPDDKERRAVIDFLKSYN